MRNAASTILFLFMCLAASAHAGTLSDGRVNGSGAQRALAVTDSGQPIPAAMAGERNEDSTTGTDYLSVAPECAYSAEIDLSGNSSTTVYNGPAILCGYTLTVTIGTAAATIDDNTTAKMTLPVSWPIGDYPNIWGIFETSLVVNPADTSTGTLQLRYRPLDASGDRAVTWP